METLCVGPWNNDGVIWTGKKNFSYKVIDEEKNDQMKVWRLQSRGVSKEELRVFKPPPPSLIIFNGKNRENIEWKSGKTGKFCEKTDSKHSLGQYPSYIFADFFVFLMSLMV